MRNGVLSREAKSEPPASGKDQPSFQEEARNLWFQADPACKGHLDPSLYFSLYSPAHPTFRLLVCYKVEIKVMQRSCPPAPLPAPPDLIIDQLALHSLAVGAPELRLCFPTSSQASSQHCRLGQGIAPRCCVSHCFSVNI